jgi:hypothetical protein
MNLAELKERWRQWVERNIGGPEGRLEIALHAAMSALSQGKSPGEAAAAARQAASNIEIAGRVRQQWRDWIERNIGGPEGRIRIAMHAAVSAISQGKSPDEAAAAARQAASAWHETQVPALLEEQVRSKIEVIAPERQVAAPKETRTPAVATTPAPRRGFIRGRVAAFQWRQERAFTNSITYPTGYQVGAKTGFSLVWDFRLERSAPDGTPLQPIAVELRSHASLFRFGTDTKGFEGSVLNGDEVEVDARHYKPGKLLKVEQVRNLTSNSVVRVRGSSPSSVFAPASAEKYSVIRGRVTTIFQRLDRPAVGIMVWSFRVQRTGPHGSLLPLVEVEMRSNRFEGSIVVGDEVELDASGYRTGDTVSVKKVRILSSNSVVRVRRGIGS